MKREELLTDAMLFFSPNERSITAENGARYYREDVVLKAMELAGKETPLPPAEGAEEKAQICPVCDGNGLVPNGFYNQTGGYWPTSSMSPETCRTCNGTGVILPSYLHAQKIADKMVEERLRQVLINYDQWQGMKYCDNYRPQNAHITVNEYLKSREK